MLSTSDNHHDWDVESYARWGTSTGKMSVLQYLRFQKDRDLPLHHKDEEVASPFRSSASVPRPLPPMRFLPCRNMHVHRSSHLWVDRLAGAAWDGCLPCVAHLMHTGKANPDQLPDFDAPFRFSAREAAFYGATVQRPMCAEVHQYLEEHFPEICAEGASPDNGTTKDAALTSAHFRRTEGQGSVFSYSNPTSSLSSMRVGRVMQKRKRSNE